MASEFINNLKKAVDTGEFNSEAAKKIIEVTELADQKLEAANKGGKPVDELVDERLKNAGIKEVGEDEISEINSEYEKKMADIKKQDGINAQLATLIEIEDMVKASIQDMMSFVEELDTKFEKEFEAEDPMFGDLAQKIEEIENKYNSIINN